MAKLSPDKMAVVSQKKVTFFFLPGELFSGHLAVKICTVHLVNTEYFFVGTETKPLELGSKFLSIDWRNHPRTQDFVVVEDKELVCLDIPFLIFAA